MSKEKKICGEKCDVYSRVVGYFRPVRLWNKGKRQEFLDRKMFVIPSQVDEDKENGKADNEKDS